MGKAQSKRSVDITTDTKKGSDEEVTEKMEKIEDTDRKEVNGDATVDPQLEKKDNDDVENDKDTTTEKNDEVQAGGDSAEQCKSSIVESTKEDGTASEEISPLTDDSAKKSKKEKVKKKWGLRSISFGKKDKQKPLKTEESFENAGATTNGTDEEKSSQETEESQKEKGTPVNSPDVTSMEVHENGAATEQEKTEKQTEEMSPDVKSNEETANTNNPTAEKNETLTIDTAENLTSQETDNTSNTPSKSDVTDIETKSGEKVINDASKNERSVEEVNATVKQPTKDEAADEVTAENQNIPADIKIDTVTINGIVDEIHQNGSDNISHQDVEETKAQIEVKSNTDNKASADSLEIISSSTYNNPPNVQDHDKHVNALGENFEDVGMEKDVEREVSNSLNKLGNRTDDGNDEKDLNVEKVESSVVKSSTDEKLVHEPSPPPLPISPPPSHVSVFAFTNKEESADDSLGKTEPISTQMEDIEDHKPATSPLNPTELSEQHSNIDDILSTDNSSSGPPIKEQCEAKICFQNNDVTILAPPPFIETEIKSTIAESEKNEVMENIELQSAEKEVDNEVLEHKNNNSLINDSKEIDDNNTSEHLKNEYEGVEEIENNEVLEYTQLNVAKEKDVELLTHKNGDLNKNCENLEYNLQNQLQETCLYTKDDNDKNTDCENENNPQSHNLDQSEADDEITQLNTHHELQMHDKTVFDKIDNLVREETKEITNTKDLKESATVAEVTQDPSVTCE